MDALNIIRVTIKEFAEVTDEEINTFVLLAEPFVNEKKFGNKYQQALAYLAAHKMKLYGFGSTLGMGSMGDMVGVSSVSEGESSVSFSNQSGSMSSDAEYRLTIYGMQFLELRRSCIMTITSAGVRYEDYF